MITLERMTEAHVEQVAALEKLLFTTPWSHRSVASEVKKPRSLWLVAVEDEKVIGYVGSQSVGEEADMMNVAVRLDCQGKGVGKMLIDGLVEALSEKGVHTLALEVRESNLGAIALYEKLGFAKVGRRPGYYRNPREDGLILRKEWTL